MVLCRFEYFSNFNIYLCRLIKCFHHTMIFVWCHIFFGIRTIAPPPRKVAPHLGLGFRSRLGLVLGLGGNQKIAPEKNWLLVRVRVWVRVSFKVGRQFPFGAIVLEPFSFCFFKSDILFSPSVCFIHCIFALCF